MIIWLLPLQKSALFSSQTSYALMPCYTCSYTFQSYLSTLPSGLLSGYSKSWSKRGLWSFFSKPCLFPSAGPYPPPSTCTPAASPPFTVCRLSPVTPISKTIPNNYYVFKMDWEARILRLLSVQANYIILEGLLEVSERESQMFNFCVGGEVIFGF